jgi:hypothetical protein
MLHTDNTFSRTSLPMPPMDFRRDVKGDRERSWLILQQTHREALQYYYVVVTKILSRLEDTSLPDLKDERLYNYYCNSHLINDVVALLLNSVDVELQCLTEAVNGAVLYKTPRIKVSSIGPYSVYLPHKR